MRLTDAEWKLMNAIWRRHHPSSARDVMEELEGQADWAYNTIKTMLSRLVDKGALSQRLRANTTLYTPLITRQQARRSAMRALLDSAFDGAFGPLMHFLLNEEKLSAKEKEELRRLLRQQEKEKQP